MSALTPLSCRADENEPDDTDCEIADATAVTSAVRSTVTLMTTSTWALTVGGSAACTCVGARPRATRAEVTLPLSKASVTDWITALACAPSAHRMLNETRRLPLDWSSPRRRRLSAALSTETEAGSTPDSVAICRTNASRPPPAAHSPGLTLPIAHDCLTLNEMEATETAPASSPFAAAKDRSMSPVWIASGSARFASATPRLSVAATAAPGGLGEGDNGGGDREGALLGDGVVGVGEGEVEGLAAELGDGTGTRLGDAFADGLGSGLPEALAEGLRNELDEALGVGEEERLEIGEEEALGLIEGLGAELEEALGIGLEDGLETALGDGLCNELGEGLGNELGEMEGLETKLCEGLESGL